MTKAFQKFQIDLDRLVAAKDLESLKILKDKITNWDQSKIVRIAIETLKQDLKGMCYRRH